MLYKIAKHLFQSVKRSYIKISEYGGKRIETGSVGNQWIAKMIVSNQPFCIARIGETELRICQEFQNNLIYSDQAKTFAFQNAGIFPNNKDTLDAFAKVYIDAIKNTDAIGVWYNPGEGKLLKRLGVNPSLFELRALESYYYSEPWSAYLQGKKVLVVHPFKESILSQLKKRELLFDNKSILPNCEIRVLKAVQSISGNSDFPDWIAALMNMKSEISKIDFDVAIIGCGAYGLPLAEYCKSLGKQAIHMGGAVQILFGIKGKRWDDHPFIGKLYNEHWVRPLESEKAKNSEKVEGGTYW